MAANHVFRGQIIRRQRQAVQGFDFQTYFLSPEYPTLVQRATRLIERDERSAEVVREYVRAAVEIEGESQLSALGNCGIQVGAHYDVLPPESDSELAEVSFACSLVQFAFAHRLWVRLSERYPGRIDAQKIMRIKRIGIKAAYEFTLKAELGERYSYEIECKLKNGAYDC